MLLRGVQEDVLRYPSIDALAPALDSALPPPRKTYPGQARPAIAPWAAVIDGWLVADQQAPRKQRHTAQRIWQRLVAEHGAVLAEVTVSRDVARRRTERELRHLTGRHPVEAAGESGETSGDFGLFRHSRHHRGVRGEVERALARHPRA